MAGGRAPNDPSCTVSAVKYIRFIFKNYICEMALGSTEVSEPPYFFSMRDASLAFFRELVDTPSVSGYEEKAAKVFLDYLSFAETEKDLHGNAYAALNPGAPFRIMLAGHIDEIGFVVHHIGDDGLLWFKTVGGHDASIVVGQRVWVHGRNGRIGGVIGRKAIHLLTDEERKKRPEIYDLWIDIGAAKKEEAEAHVELGDHVTYQWEYAELLNGRATARGFDNKMGAFMVAEALRLLHEDGGLHPEVGVIAVGTVQEEIGLRGARTAAARLKPRVGIAVDVNHANDIPGVAKTRYGQLDVGKGPSVVRGPNANPALFRLIRQAGDEDKIPYQVDIEPAGTGTDGNAMQINPSEHGGMAVAILGVALRYMHTPCEVLSLEDVENGAKLIAATIRRIGPDTDFVPGR